MRIQFAEMTGLKNDYGLKRVKASSREMQMSEIAKDNLTEERNKGGG